MARPFKETVDYFPHDCEHGQTMFIIESRYGNDGYSFWFKLLERLGKQKGHCLDLNDDIALEFLAAKTRLTTGKTLEIIDLLAKLDAIDRELWEKGRLVWCQNFVNRIAGAYTERKKAVPEKPQLQVNHPINDVSPPINEVIPSNTGREIHKLNKIKLNKKEYSPDFESFWQEIIHRPDDRKADAWKHWQKMKDIPPIDTLLAAVKKYNKSKENQDKQFLISTFRWIENRMWEQNSELPGNGKSKPESWSIADWKFYTDVERTGSIGNQEQYDRYLKLDRELKQIRKSDDGINL